MMKVNAYGNEYDVEITRTTYRNNGALALILTCDDGEPFATLTVNLPDYDLNDSQPDLAFIDTNNCYWAEDFINENNLGYPVGIIGYSGYCSYPLYRFNLDEIRCV